MTNAAEWDIKSIDSKISRREFCRYSLLAGLGMCAWDMIANPVTVLAVSSEFIGKRAMYYKKLPDGRTQCMLCPNRCVRNSDENGQCRARGNRNGAYYSLVYGQACVIALDEVEKCPLNHFQVENKVFSIATAGCNLSCQYCQNWEFSQAGPDEVGKVYKLSPRQVVLKAQEHKANAIAYFYTEPTVYYEYMLDIAKLAHEKGLKNIMVTAGYINAEPLQELLPYLDAITIGLKSWNEDFYRRYIGGELVHVKETIKILSGQDKVWWEVVNLIVTSLNDNMQDIAQMSKWLCETAGPYRPLHFTRFRPQYQLKRLPMTPVATLTEARQVAMAQGLKFVYVGNMPGHEGSHTYCPQCGKMIIERLAFKVLEKKISDGQCSYCGCKIGGVWL